MHSQMGVKWNNILLNDYNSLFNFFACVKGYFTLKISSNFPCYFLLNSYLTVNYS